MATSFTGSLGQTNNYSSITELITQWPTAAQNQSIQLSGIAFDGGETNYLDPTVISNLTLETNESPKSWLTYGAVAGIGVPSSYEGWFTNITKTRAEINYNPNTNQTQVLKMKWADTQEITSATIGISALLPKSSSVVDDQGNEVGLLQLFKDGAPVSASNFTITRLNAPAAPKPITVSSNAVTFIGDRIDGNFTFEIVGDSLTGASFDELQFSTKAYDSPTDDYLNSRFKDDSSDYLVRNIEYQGIFNVTPTSPSLFEFQQPNYTVPEGGVATINVIRTGGTGAASINYATVDGTASSGGTAADYTSAAGALNFAAGQTTASFTVTALSDLILESPETVSLVLSGGNVGSNPSILTINDVPPPPTPTPTPPTLFEFQQPNYTVPEGGVATINVIRTGGTGAASINYATVDGSATSGGTAADYTSAAGALNFAAGQTTASFTVTALSDLILESPETVSLVLSGGNVGSNPSFLTINDVPPPPTPTPTPPTLFEFQQPNYTVPEGGVATINVIRTGGTGAASINYATVDGSATSGGTAADYTSAAGALNFAAGQTTASFTVTALSDLILESPETVSLVLSGGNVGSNPSFLTILDVPPTPTPTPTPTPSAPSLFQFAQPNYTVAEGGVATINVTRTGGTAAASINYQTLDGSATSGGTAADYTRAAGVLSFAAGQTTANFTVTALSDMMQESPETVNLVLFGGNVSNPSILTINDVPPPPGTTPALPSLFQFAQPNYTVAEAGVVTINVTRTGGTAAASINYQTLDGSASSGGSTPDYTAAAGSLDFPAGQTTASFTVAALSDMMLESPETVNLVLFGGNVSSPSILTINDVPPPDSTSPIFFQFAQPIYTVAEGGVATITVTRTGGLGAASIGYTTLDGSASSPADYTGATGTLNFIAGQTTASFSVTTLMDMMPESPETVGLVLLGGNVGGPPSTLTINDVPPNGTSARMSASLFEFAQPNSIDPSFVGPTSFFYGSSPDPIIDGGPGVGTINRTGNTSVPPSVDYLIAAGGSGQPVNNVDYIPVCLFPVSPTGDTVNFNSGQTSVSLTMNNPLGLTSGVVNLGFGPGLIGAPPSTAITLI
jgi:hypothetical protein